MTAVFVYLSLVAFLNLSKVCELTARLKWAKINVGLIGNRFVEEFSDRSVASHINVYERYYSALHGGRQKTSKNIVLF